MRRRLLIGAAVALGALGAGPAAASAHPLLLQAAPAPGLIAPKAPAAVSLALSEPAVARGSRIVVRAGSRSVPVAQLTAADGGRTLSVRPLGRLRSAVYTVRWTALGDDGHTVSGTFSFGVAGAKGAPPPGAERLGGAGAGGRGGESAAAESAVSIVARWVGIVSASTLFGGFALVALIRRRRVAVGDAAAPVRTVAPLAWLLLLTAASEGVIAGAMSGAGSKFDFGLLTGSPTGRAELARAAVLAAATVALGIVGARRRARDLVYAGGGAAALGTYAASGHALANPTVLELVAQVAHVLAAGLWVGGVIGLVLVARSGALGLADGAKAFAPAAAGALALAAATGVLAAVREVDNWYFLRWSSYGNVVIAKSIAVALVAAAGGFAAWRAASPTARRRRPSAPQRGQTPLVDTGLFRLEAFGLLAVVGLAATLSGLAQGRGQPLPAARGSLLPGPAIATALLPSGAGAAQLVLAPARSGPNVASVTLPPGARPPSSVGLRLACTCAAPAITTMLHEGAGGSWSARVSLPRDGTWYGYLRVDGRSAAAPVPLAVGVPRAPGAPPAEVLAVADLSGPDAARCASHVLGLELGIGRINATGGLEGGHKVAPLVLDDGGDAGRSATVARAAIARAHPIALAAPCGDGAGGAVRAAAAAGLPSIVGDPSVDPVSAPDVFRLAADPYAQGVALGQYVARRIATSATAGSRTVRAIVGADLQGRRLLAGLRSGLGTIPLGVQPPGTLARAPRPAIRRLLTRSRSLAVILDGPASGGADAAALARFGRAAGNTTQVPVLTSERVISERLVTAAGALGRIGALQGLSEVSTATRDSQYYGRAVQLLYPGERPSLDGLRGYIAGLALVDAVAKGTSRSAIEARLRRPAVFTNALLAPWVPTAPGLGSQALFVIAPQFLPATLVPTSAGGESYQGTYFSDGDWINATTTAFGPGAGATPPPLR